MAKQNPIKRYREQHGLRNTVPVATTSQALADPDQTLGPEVGIRVSIANVLQSDSTSALPRDDGEKGKSEETYATTPYELFDKFVSGKIRLSVRTTLTLISLLWFSATLWLLIQDNNAGRTEVLGWIEQFFRIKVFATTALLAVPFVLILLGELGAWTMSKFEKPKK